jgi:ferredoxin
VEGSQNLTPPSREERDFLKKLRRPDNERLACQCQVLGDVSIEYLGG